MQIEGPYAAVRAASDAPCTAMHKKSACNGRQPEGNVARQKSTLFKDGASLTPYPNQ